MNHCDQGAIALVWRCRVRKLSAVLVVSMVAVALATTPSEPAPASMAPSAFTAASWDDAEAVAAAGPEYPGAMRWVTHVIGAKEYWSRGYVGKGVDVAVIDTGIVPVPGLTSTGKVLDAPDFSFDTISEPLRHLDSYGHGTHLAGIIAGNDHEMLSDAATMPFVGVAPGARLVNVKVGDVGGVVDVSQVIAALDWVVRNRHGNGLNIRVVNLSYGTDGGALEDDALVQAVERAWRAGIVVVVAGGNAGNGAKLRNPALSPWVIAVGASDSGITPSTADDVVLAFSNCGTTDRSVDIVAPGRSIVSLRTPGSTVDLEFPEARIGERFFLGSGTSQAAAVISGAAALVVQQRPDISPDQVKALLVQTAQPLPNTKSLCQGGGLVDLTAALATKTPSATPDWKLSKGAAGLEAARGSFHVELDGDVLDTDRDIHGEEWDPKDYYEEGEGLEDFMEGWSATSWSGLSWSGLSWSGLTWSGLSWSGLSWSGLSWSGLSWSGLSWSAGTWSGLNWR